MKTLKTLAGCAFAICIAAPAFAATQVRFNINLGNAPPPPVYVVQHAPRTVWMPESRVYMVHDSDFDDDTFQCGAFWYSYHDGWWYRARSWRGPFAVIDARYVPQSVMVVPEREWRHNPHGMPPGQMRRGWDGDRREAWDDHDNGRGRGHDRGRGHGHDHDDN